MALAASAPLSVVAHARADHYPSAVVLDPANHSIYVANNGTNDISVLDQTTCNAAATSTCAQAHPRQDAGEIPAALALNPVTQTLYVANYGNTLRSRTLSIVDAARCRAGHSAGCSHFPRIAPGLGLPFSPNDIAVDSRTDTIYVDGEQQLAVIDGSRCRAGSTYGCRRAMRLFTIPGGAGAVTFDPGTRTVYVVGYFSGLLSVIDARSCRAGNTTRCRPRATVKLGHHPWRSAVDPASDSLYVTLFGAGTVAVIDARACNGHEVSGCRRRPAQIRVGGGPEGLAFDGPGALGFVTDASSGFVSVFDTTHCRGADTRGCGPALGKVRVGGLPDGIAFDARTNSLYVTDNASTTKGLAVLEVSGRG